MNDMKHSFMKKFHRSSLTAIISVAVMLGVITCVIASAPKPVSEPADPGLSDSGITRIEVPSNEIDTYARPALLAEEEPVTIQSPVFATPETTDSSDVEPESEPAVESELPTETAAPETTAPETAAPETAAAPEPETEAIAPAPEPEETTAAVVTVSPEPQTELYADKYKVKGYKIVKPGFEVSEYEIKLAATVIQLEVMGSGSELDAFEDTTEKYIEMLSVAEVIRNRVDSEKFPDTVEEVILQKIGNVPQFSPRETLEYYGQFVTTGAMAAAREALVVGVMVKPSNLCYFCATSIKAQFEEWNAAALVPDGNGSYVQWDGHLTTFYAGHINSDK